MKIFLGDDFIFLNLSCNFTVNNCIVLFQVAKKPEPCCIYSLMLELYGWVHICGKHTITAMQYLRKERPLIHSKL